MECEKNFQSEAGLETDIFSPPKQRDFVHKIGGKNIFTHWDSCTLFSILFIIFFLIIFLSVIDEKLSSSIVKLAGRNEIPEMF